MHLHLASTRVICSSCHSCEFKPRALSIRRTTSPDTALQRVHRKRSRACTVSCSAAAQDQHTMGADVNSTDETASASHDTDFVVIGSGIGGLCCAAMLARYGYEVTVCESHYALGGAAHSFKVKGHHFDSGPSFFAGLSGEGNTSNPLKQVLNAVGEQVECAIYDRWVTHTPEGSFATVCNGNRYAEMVRSQGGETALKQWKQLEDKMRPLQQGAALFPAAALRSDPGVVLSMLRFGPKLALTGLQAPTLTAPFAKVVDQVVTDPWLRKFLDLECFVLSGMLAKDTICAEMAFMLMERNREGSTIDYPMGGTSSIVDALRRGIEKHGGKIMLGSHVEEILVKGGKANGVRIHPANSRKPPTFIKARKGVISNASVWDTQTLLPNQDITPKQQQWSEEAKRTPQTGSFMHLHLGIDAKGLDPNLDCHHLVVNDWQDLEAAQNVCIISIPSVFDSSLAPAGKHTIHAYVAANEPYNIWQGLDKNSKEYKDLKAERAEPLWKALERVIPDIRKRAEVTLIGSPLTHEFWLRRNRGTYGAAISARNGSFPGPQTPIKGLYRCGDSCQPGIGVPAAAASGLITANTLAPIWSHIKMLDQIKM
ncbi:hypothetical protein ABBQ38_012286 [Trebouxia sp. C0009 RCD-2024]